jgi:hypothetical protein
MTSGVKPVLQLSVAEILTPGYQTETCSQLRLQNEPSSTPITREDYARFWGPEDDWIKPTIVEPHPDDLEKYRVHA